MKPSIIILAYNSEATIAMTIDTALRVSDDIHVVDSFSTDATRRLVQERSAKFAQHEFVNYAEQRNWAIDTLPLKYNWELHLDADEFMSDNLVSELQKLTEEVDGRDLNGYHLPRLTRFLGRYIRHGGMFPIWHMRLFRHGKGRCENREYDQHFVVAGTTGRLYAPIIDDMRMPLNEWVLRHNRWSDAEVRELRKRNGIGYQIQPRLRGSPIERKRYFRGMYSRSPLFVRVLVLFVYRYLLRGGFLDGREGLIFFVLQAWYRFMVDAKLYERTEKQHREGFDSAGTTIDGSEEKAVNRTQRTPAAHEVIVEK
jgi:glycosyltransferase involved in cell wall biosynthesis